MSAWRDQRNAVSRARLDKALPSVFPKPVLIHALSRPLIPPLPRLAVESYWANHPMRADRLARALARRSQGPEGWRWREARSVPPSRPTLRQPPAPFRDPERSLGPGFCCICGQPVFRFGWHVDLWRDGQVNRRASWHGCCVAAWKLWNAPHLHRKTLTVVQRRRCAKTGKRLLRDGEVDHRVPLYRVWRDHADEPWPDLLRFWGFPNLQAINKAEHLSKTAAEAADRAGRSADLRSPTRQGGSTLEL